MKTHINKKYSLIIAAAMIIVAATTSCELDEDMTGAVTSDTYYGSVTALDNGLIGVFSNYHSIPTSGSLFKDNLAAFTGADDLTAPSDKPQFYEADKLYLTGGNTTLSDSWRGHYKAIDGCNEFIKNVDLVNFPDDEEYCLHALGNAHFIRAILYFDLVLMFGEVPLITEPTISTSLTKSTQKEVLLQVIEDLKFAKKHVINERDTKAGVDAKVIDGHATKTAATAYLAKAHMALAGWPSYEDGQWTLVKDYCFEIIDAGVYTMLDDYAHNFGNVGEVFTGVQDWEGNAESVWARTCYSSELYATDSRYYGKFWQDWMDFLIEHAFYEKMPDDYRNQFSATDDSNWSYLGFTGWKYCDVYEHPTVMKFLWGGIDKLSWKKYTGSMDNHPGFESAYRNSADITIIRYSEVLLMYAEACARTGDNTTGMEYLNKVRRRAYANGLPAVIDTIANAGLPTAYWNTPGSVVDYPKASGENHLDTKTNNPLIDAIIAERSFEFLAEPGGVRWFDITRLGIVAEALKDRDPREYELEGDPSDEENWRMPIPSGEYEFNPGLRD